MPKTPDTVQMVERLVELSNKHQIHYNKHKIQHPKYKIQIWGGWMGRVFQDRRAALTKVTPNLPRCKWLKTDVEAARLGRRRPTAKRRQLSSTRTPRGFNLQATRIHRLLCRTTTLSALCLFSPLPRILTGRGMLPRRHYLLREALGESWGFIFIPCSLEQNPNFWQDFVWLGQNPNLNSYFFGGLLLLSHIQSISILCSACPLFLPPQPWQRRTRCHWASVLLLFFLLL